MPIEVLNLIIRASVETGTTEPAQDREHKHKTQASGENPAAKGELNQQQHALNTRQFKKIMSQLKAVEHER